VASKKSGVPIFPTEIGMSSNKNMDSTNPTMGEQMQRLALNSLTACPSRLYFKNDSATHSEFFEKNVPFSLLMGILPSIIST